MKSWGHPPIALVRLWRGDCRYPDLQTACRCVDYVPVDTRLSVLVWSIGQHK